MEQVLSDAMLTVIAGSDTTATTLGTIFYCLLTNPDSMKRLQEELDSVFPPKGGCPVEARKLAELPYLNAVMCVMQVLKTMAVSLIGI